MPELDLAVGTVVFDCASPNEVARWWGELLGASPTLDDLDEWASLPTPGRVGKLGFQKVPEGKVVKNRLHLDLFTKEVQATVSRILALGGRHLWDSPDPDDVFVTMADPEGNEFDVCLLED